MERFDRVEKKNEQQAEIQQRAGGAFKIVALAASAGGLSALSQVLGGLPADFPASIVIVQRLDPRHRSLMAEILGKRTKLAVKQAEDDDQMQPGWIYIAPPDHHLLVNRDSSLSLSQSELVHFVRPSADLLFDSMAASYGEQAIAVVLTGSGSDGEMGVKAVKERGGTVIAQNEETAEYFGMPGAAITTKSVDFVLALDEIAPALVTLIMGEEE
ncbi:MAG: chemotaxis protein CheB [Anaerolineales bacterium]|jgi:two-component system chemotaxis response regulator CheB